MRLFRRSTLVAVAVAVLAWLSLAGAAGGGGQLCPRAVKSLGLIAFAAHGRVELVDLARCRVTALPASGASDVRFSPNGRWLAYGRLEYGTPTMPVVVPAQGGPARTPLGRNVLAWTWGPTGAVLYGITRNGSLVSAGPRGPRRVVAANAVTIYNGYYGEWLALSPNGQLAAVDRSSCRGPGVGELDTVDVHTGALSVAVRQTGHFFTFAGWSSDGHWLLFWDATQCSGSLAADGWPLEAVPAGGGSPVRVVRSMLLFDDYLSWCGSRLIVASGPDRQTNMDSKLLSVAPPGWRARTIERAGKLSWVSPSCAPGGRILTAAAGPNSSNASFGSEHRSIWRLRPDGSVLRRLVEPPAADLSDEAPRFSRDGRWIMFVRSQLLAVGRSDSSRDTIELVRASGAGGAIPIVSFTSADFSYYDHYEWPYEVDWYQPR